MNPTAPLPDETAFVAWIRTIQRPETVEDLLRLPPRRVRHLVGRHVDGSCLTEALLEDLLNHFGSRQGLLHNSSLSDDQVEHALSWTLERTIGGSESGFVQTYQAFEEQGRALQRQDWAQRLRQYVRLAIQHDDEAVTRDEGLHAAGALLDLFWSDVTEADLLAIEKLGATHHLVAIASHPQAPLSLLQSYWDTAVRDHSIALQRAIAANPRTHESPVLAEKVLNAEHPYVLAEVARAQAPDQIASVIERLCAKSPKQGWLYVTSLPAADRSRIAPSALTPLLDSDDQDIRLNAQMFLADLRAKDPVERPPVPFTSGVAPSEPRGR